MKPSWVLIGIVVAALLPAPVVHATMFDTFYEESQNASADTKPSERIAQFVVKEMESWNTRGIQLTVDDIDVALAAAYAAEGGDGLCDNKVDMAGNPYTFEFGPASTPGTCLALRASILSVLNAEREAEELGSDLMTIASSSELAVADEPHRPLDMALYTLLLRRVWSGTGASIIPWDGSADSQFDTLDGHLKALDEEDLEKAVLRFHHGYFRDQREADPRMSGVMDQIGDDLSDLASALGITGDPQAVGIFATPKLQAKNVALWIRRDDVGLLWIYPTGAFRLNLRPADEYPEFVNNGESLAYPFAYEGGAPPSGPGIESPLCSRMIGRQGYLCRPLPPTAENCENTDDGSNITLVKCSEEVTETQSGPEICKGFEKLFSDTGLPLQDPANPGRLNPALTKADYAKICSPENKVIYQDDITSNACYVGLCLLQSMSGHTLVPNRNPVLLNEATSPYLACIRPDPQLGLYTEIAEDSPYPLPEYLGVFLVNDFERQYCSKDGDAPQALLGLCAYNDNANAALPIANPLVNEQVTAASSQFLAARGEDFNAIAASVGQRVALNQTIELERKMFAKLAHFIQHIADLFGELKRAPITQSACPWTGMFKIPSPGG